MNYVLKIYMRLVYVIMFIYAAEKGGIQRILYTRYIAEMEIRYKSGT